MTTKITTEELNLVDNLLFNYRLEQMRMGNWAEAERVTTLMRKLKDDDNS